MNPSYMRPPKWLDHRATLLFNELKKHTTDKQTLAILCDSYSTYQAATRDLNDNKGLMLGDRAHPALDIQDKAWRRYLQARKMLNIGGVSTGDIELDDDEEE